MVATTFGHYVQAACLKAYSHGHMYASASVIMSHIPDEQTKSIAKVNKWLTKQSDCYDVSDSGKKYKLAKGTSGDVRKRMTAMGLLDAETSKPVAKKSKSHTQSPKKTIAKAKKPKAKKPKAKKAEAKKAEAEAEEAEAEEAEGEEAEGEEAEGEEAEGEEAGEDAAVEEAGKDAAGDDQAEEAQGEAEKPDDN